MVMPLMRKILLAVVSHLPAFLDLKGEVKMGEKADLTLQPGQCCWIPTGGMLPEGSNAAVMVEYTEKLGEDTVLIYRPAGPWENIMQKGEDIAEGQEVISAGKEDASTRYRTASLFGSYLTQGI
jgi:molybdopterin biosynthesis enzyme